MADEYVLQNGVARERVERLNKDVECALNRLEQAMLSGQSQTFLDALAWWGKFHKYSLNNSLLIRMQAPHTHQVAGYKAWQAMGWQVRKGAMAVWLRAPWLKKHTDTSTGEITQRLVGYYPVAVFPIELTVEWAEGKRPPEPLIPATGAEWEDLYIKWSRRLTTLYGIEVTEMQMGNAYGTASPKRIRINSSKVIATKATTLIHETAHILAKHHQAADKPLKQRELEVEAATYVLCAILGAEHPAASDYLLSYEVEPNELADNLEVIGKIVRDVKEVLHAGFKEEFMTPDDSPIMVPEAA